jgi:predicted enzyme related to lactoylglutathione lyase
MTHQHHGIDYVELNAPDQEASRGFYAAAFGWGFNDYGPEYSGIQGPSGDAAPADAPEIGGLSTQGPATPLVILYSEDIDSTLAADASTSPTRPGTNSPSGGSERGLIRAVSRTAPLVIHLA